MPAPIELRSDNAAGACAEVLAAVAAANDGSAPSYGADQLTAQLRERVREVFDHSAAEVFPVVSGTAANAVGLAAICPPWGAVLCHESAHIAVNECGATSHLSGGAVLRLLPGEHGRIDPPALEAVFASTWWGDPHHSQPAALSITCPSDLGTISTPAQIATLTSRAHDRGLRGHLDGARLANALAALGCDPAEITWRAGIDVLSLGATKNGGLCADAVVVFDPGIADELRYRLKRAGHVPSKMRFLSAQLLAVLADGLWLRLASHANEMAGLLAEGLSAAGLTPVHPVDANLVFLHLAPATSERLHGSGVRFQELGPGVARFVTSWQTTPDEIAAAVDRIRRAAATPER